MSRGYAWWDGVCGSPRHVSAPMVDMSELSFRMLCRGHGAQLCYSPMLHSQQFVQDALYRTDLFSTCPEDRPLVVQFCANEADTFVAAARAVAEHCDAVDLNLGCPQAIARKGHYGAFLQDDWDLIRAMIGRASAELPVPVTAKMRILPGAFGRSVEYARMLERAGCSLLAVHGRTREQKGHATGLASWEAIREIKAHVRIPVVANGNVLCFGDVERCLEYTGADAVMSAEALLHNPALFSGRCPPVWEVVEEYLALADEHHTPARYVRCHLFKILYLCIHRDESIRETLIEATSVDEFRAVLPRLRALQPPGAGADGEPYLPVWTCHSRPRIADDERNRGCYSKYFPPLPPAQDDETQGSKKKQRRERHHARVLAAMKDKRKTKKMRRKQKLREMRQSEPVPEVREDAEKVTKKEQKRLIRERLLAARGTAPRVCVHLGFAAHMDTKGLHRLSSQLRRLYGSNRHSERPLHLYFCGFEPALRDICEAKNDGFASYVIEMSEECPEALFDADRLVYLSPDSEHVLDALHADEVYVIGGIVDDTVRKNLSLEHARSLNVRTARLPIAEFLERCSPNPGTQVLTVNQVFDVLLAFHGTGDWTAALATHVPRRKGFCTPRDS